MFQRFSVFLLVALLSACGSDSSPSGPTSVSVDRTEINIESTSSEYITKVIKVSLKNVPEDGVFAGVLLEDEDSSIDHADIKFTSKSNANLEVSFSPSYDVGKGTYENQVTLLVCLDAQCNEQVEGSPVLIDTVMVSDPGGHAVASMDETEFRVIGSTVEGDNFLGGDSEPPETTFISINVDGLNLNETLVLAQQEQAEYPTISNHWLSTSEDKNVLEVSYQAPELFPHGHHEIVYTVDVCATGGLRRIGSCTYPIEGSPFTVTVTYEINKIPASTITIEPSRSTVLNHDFIDAESSELLNALAVVTSEPSNALVVYDLNDVSSSASIKLSSLPTSVSFVNNGNGNTLFVGHDTGITVVNYDQVSKSFTTPEFIETTESVKDLVATDSAVHWLSGENLHSIDLQTHDVSTVVNQYGNSFYTYRDALENTLRLHPDLDTVYVAESGGLDVIDLTANPAKEKYSASRIGPSFLCRQVWLSREGERVYSRCSHVFNAYDEAEGAMSQFGVIPLLTRYDTYFTPYIMSLSESVGNEIAVIENSNEVSAECEYIGLSDGFYSESYDDACFFVLSFFAKDTLELISAAPFDKVTIDNVSYKEIPEFVTFNRDGSKTFVIVTADESIVPQTFLVEFDR